MSDLRTAVARAMFLANMKPGVNVERYDATQWLRQRWGLLKLADAAIEAIETNHKEAAHEGPKHANN